MIQSSIVINLPVGKDEAERYRKIIARLISQGALDIQYGSSTLHYNNKELMAIDLNIKAWKLDK
jgi:hypothetical protein